MVLVYFNVVRYVLQVTAREMMKKNMLQFEVSRISL